VRITKPKVMWLGWAMAPIEITIVKRKNIPRIRPAIRYTLGIDLSSLYESDPPDKVVELKTIFIRTLWARHKEDSVVATAPAASRQRFKKVHTPINRLDTMIVC
jgi:hypothetical protein